MGKIADSLNKPKTRKKREKKSKVKKPVYVLTQDASPESKLTAEQIALRKEAAQAQLHFACISYDRALRTCSWCCKEFSSMYDLGFANPYRKTSLCSEECQRKWYIWNGRKYKNKDDID